MILFTADLHGNRQHYQKILELVKNTQPQALLLAGDLFPKEGGLWSPENKVRTIAAQKKFLDEFFFSFLKRVAQTCPVFFIFGNDDFASNVSYVKKNLPANTYLLHGEVAPLGNYWIAGFPYVAHTPFLQKDWEHWDDEPGHKAYITKGYTSSRGKHHPVDYEDEQNVIKKLTPALQKLAKKSPPAKTIYLIHEPPYNTHLDQTSTTNPYTIDGNLHIGSKSVRQFIETSQPLLTLHGHIHETVHESGEYQESIGKTTSIAAGNIFTDEALAVTKIWLETPIRTERISV